MRKVEHIDSQRRRLKSGFQSKCISWELDNKVSPPSSDPSLNTTLGNLTFPFVTRGTNLQWSKRGFFEVAFAF